MLRVSLLAQSARLYRYQIDVVEPKPLTRRHFVGERRLLARQNPGAGTKNQLDKATSSRLREHNLSDWTQWFITEFVATPAPLFGYALEKRATNVGGRGVGTADFLKCRIAALVVLGISLAVASPVVADELLVPFSCGMKNGEPQLSASSEISYAIVGARDEQPFTSCGSGPSAACVTMMVHRFNVMCGDKRVAWAKFAAAAREHGAKLPIGLPAGFAPVSAVAGRLVLPSYSTSKKSVLISPVAMQDLSPDSVIESPSRAFRSQSSGPAWETVVQVDVLPVAESGLARVATVLLTVLAMLMAASLVVAGRMPDVMRGGFSATTRASTWLPEWQRLVRHVSIANIATVLVSVASQWITWVAGCLATLRPQRASHSDDALSQSMPIVEARLAETDLLVATLPDGLLLRDVLQGEIDRVRARAKDAEKNLRRRAPDQSAAIFRTLLRELDRISRIARSAINAPGERSEHADDHHAGPMPRTRHDAYRLLGLNADAPPAVAKKLVDALRMTWHPDYARDEADRRRREARMKQINAAWDMIKERRAAA